MGRSQHTLLLKNAHTIGAAFASAASESISMIFDMTKWDTELVLDVMELLHTNYMDHLRPLQMDSIFPMFELLLFLDHPDALPFLCRAMTSALYTLDMETEREICYTPDNLKHFDYYLGLIGSEDHQDVKLVS